MENMLAMVIMAAVSPIMAKAAERIITWVCALLAAIYGRSYQLVSRQINVVTIRKKMVFSDKRGLWVVARSDQHNSGLVDAVLHNLTENGIHAVQSRCVLGDPCINIRSMKEYELSRPLMLVPQTACIHGMFTIQYMQAETTSPEGRTDEISIIITSAQPVSEINKYILASYKSYISKQFDVTSPDRYLYKQIPSKEGSRFMRYKIDNATTFARMHFPAKPRLLQMINKFTAGDLRKLSLLLYGVPGCGKTSIIKAIAAMLQYDVVEVKLGFILNDAQIINILHSPTIMYFPDNDETARPLHAHVPLTRRIYIFEDVDAESNATNVREGPTECTAKLPRPAEPAADSTIGVASIADTAKKDTKKTTIDNMYASAMKKFLRKGLTLSGILNALDGVLELSGCVLVFTTNHPERLDPAMIRPGRITMSIEMKRMLAADARALITGYFGSAAGIDLCDDSLTPATLDAYCAMAADLEDLGRLLGATSM